MPRVLKNKNYLQDWRKNNCDEVSEDEFNEKIKNNRENRNFMGLVFPAGKRTNGNYNYAIFTGDTKFVSDYKKDQNTKPGYSFGHARFQGKFVFLSSCIFSSFPFLEAKICKKGEFSIFGNVGSFFKEKQGNTTSQEPFSDLKIEEGGGLFFLDCFFPDGFTLRNLNLKNAYFGGSNIEKVRFINCEFTEEKGNFLTPARFMLFDEKRVDEKVDEISHGELATMYQLMKKSFEDQKDYQTAGKFYVSEMVFRQKEATGLKKFFLSAYGFLAGYGESVWRTGFFLLFCLLFSGFLPFIASLFSSALSWAALLLSSHCSCTSIDSFFHFLQALFDVLKSGSTKLLLLGSSEEKTWADIISRSLFIVSGFLFINAIRRRLRRS